VKKDLDLNRPPAYWHGFLFGYVLGIIMTTAIAFTYSWHAAG
jgi:hypothetical protein